jgi:hypothetical protein
VPTPPRLWGFGGKGGLFVYAGVGCRGPVSNLPRSILTPRTPDQVIENTGGAGFVSDPEEVQIVGLTGKDLVA